MSSFPLAPDVRFLQGRAERLARKRAHALVDSAHVIHVLVRRDSDLLERVFEDVSKDALHGAAEEQLRRVPVALRRAFDGWSELAAALFQPKATGPVTYLDVLERAVLEPAGIELSRRIFGDAGELAIRLADERSAEAKAGGTEAPPERTATEALAEGPEQLLVQLGRDLVALARDGGLDPVIGRDDEINALMRNALQRRKASSLLVGDAGVGKSSVVEGLATRVAVGEVPSPLQNARIVEVSMAALLASAKHRGDLERRLKALLEAVRQSETPIILFLDELHVLAKAGGDTSSPLDMLKPALARGELKVIGATTHSEYRRYIAEDAALERRFTVVAVTEPPPETAVRMLGAQRPILESHFDLQISNEALDAAVALGRRYLPDRRLPDKAVDLLESASADRLLRAEASTGSIGPDDVAEAVARRTSIPVGRLRRSEADQLRALPDALRRCIFGQDAVIDAIVYALARRRSGVGEPNRPLGAFLLQGPTGVGKTITARTLAAELFGSERALIRLDMGECQDKAAYTRMVGAPPGYVGFEQGGQLTEAIRRRPYSVVLFDEVEKAHPDVLSLLLPILDEGRLTDGHGRVADFSHSLIILTSNVGATEVEALRPEVEGDRRRSLYRDGLLRALPSELVGRLDVQVFERLGPEAVDALARRELDGIAARVLAARDCKVSFDAEILGLAREAFDPIIGGRSVLAYVRRAVERPLSAALLTETSPSNLYVTVDGNEVVVREA